MSRSEISDAVVLAWARLNLAQRRVFEAVESEVREHGFPALAWYDVLLELWRRSPGCGLSQADLQQELLFAQYKLSRLIDRMEEAGLVRREPHPEDRRARWIVATEKGLALRAQIWPVYAAAIERHIGAKLSDTEAATLAALLGKLIGR